MAARRSSLSSLPQYSSIGSYTILYLDKKGHALCARCASKPGAEIVRESTYDEGPAIECDGCGKKIKSSYGVAVSARPVSKKR